MAKSIKLSRLNQVNELLSKIPDGRKQSYHAPLLYKLAKRGIVMTKSSLVTALSSGYCSVFDEIMESLTELVNEFIEQDSFYQEKLLESQSVAA